MREFFQKFILFTMCIIPGITQTIDFFFNNNYTLSKIYFVNIFTIYFIIIMYIILYFTVLRRINFIREMIEGPNT